MSRFLVRGCLARVPRTATAAALLLGAAVAAASPFRPGPAVLDSEATGTGAELGFVTRADAVSGDWPPELLERVRQTLGASGGVLAVGRTDPIGPQSLNGALGLQLAAGVARRLAAALDAAPARFAVASRGEAADLPPGVILRAWRPPPADAPGAARLAVLEPLPGVAPRGRFWAVWQGDTRGALWALGGAAAPRVWRVPPHPRTLDLPLPGHASETAFAYTPTAGADEAVQVEVAAPRRDSGLRLRVAGVEPGWVRARVRVPPGYRHPVVWAGGIPYPLVPDGRGDAAVAVARVGAETRAYAQAVGPAGEAVTGPPLLLPDDGEPLPAFLAVLVWGAEGADLDLHAWDGPRHTHLGSPDPAYSEAAVPGLRLLFDGDGWRPASAVAGWGPRPPELTAHCYSDLGGAGTTAWLYVIDRDAGAGGLERRLLGPRRLSEHPTEVNWPVLRPPAVAAR